MSDQDQDQVALWAARVGERVVVRHRLPTGQLTDAVGPLTAVDRAGAEFGGHAVLRVLTRRGESVIQLRDVVAGKVVPPRPSRAAPPG